MVPRERESGMETYRSFVCWLRRENISEVAKPQDRRRRTLAARCEPDKVSLSPRRERKVAHLFQGSLFPPGRWSQTAGRMSASPLQRFGPLTDVRAARKTPGVPAGPADSSGHDDVCVGT